jgi:hypothetical protein
MDDPNDFEWAFPKIGHLMGHYMIPHHVLHIFSLETAITFEPIIRSN